MGTSGLQGFRVGGEDKVSYHHHDCYPSGLGKAVLKYVRDCGSMEVLRERAQAIRVVKRHKRVSRKHLTAAKALLAEQREAREGERETDYPSEEVCLPGPIQRWLHFTYESIVRPNISLESLTTLGFLVDHSSFLADCLYNQWTYIINVDDGVLEVYHGEHDGTNGRGRYASLLGAEMMGWQVCGSLSPSIAVGTSSAMTYSQMSDVDWAHWVPNMPGTLMVVVKGGRALMIVKKRGFGVGKVTAPGGKTEKGETPLQCVMRETEEELVIVPQGVEEAGQVSFQFTDGLAIHCHVYSASGYTGTPTETDEALPLWVDVDRVPYDRMWADDESWLPLLFEGTYFHGRYLFEGDTMLGMDIVTGDQARQRGTDGVRR
ncbi:7,8-dihydro-8-oxoguanine triphosphatase [Kipferlia bialata]|uniref:Oxidized purine nucleoside triphosphate hydrolase n=1 Tax=Kipferlia bialata TaxID=797122 RepID=A0A9K3CXI1_9EUKA|nr:7,8-dihydro-8-oxoguanine triphosphatase [Kipferlia bialata]|eukprot:g6787.t1